MKRSLYLLLATMILASCGGGDKKDNNKDAELAKLKKQKAEIDGKIQALEAEANKNKPKPATPVSLMEIQPGDFTSTIDVQATVTGDQNVTAIPQAGGIVTQVNVRAGQKVSKGQVLAVLDAAAVEQQILAQDAQLTLARQLYDKQQKLWAQNIGTEVQLLQAKAQYESAAKQKASLVAQRNMYRVVAPISGTVDYVGLKVGDGAGGMITSGIRIVSLDKLKVEAELGENYLGKVKEGDPATILLTELNDSIKTRLSYVGQSIDLNSRAFPVEIRLGANNKLRPNMSAKLKIANYHNSNALVIPVSVIQKTAQGDMIYIADGKKAKAVYIKTGRSSNGMVEVLSGLSAGDRIVTEGFQELDNGEAISY